MNDTEIPVFSRQRVVRFITHLLCLVILFVLPEVLFNYGREQAPNSFVTYAKATVFVLTFYIEYYIILNHEYSRKTDTCRFLGCNALLLVGSMTVIFLILKMSPLPMRHRGENPDLALLRQASFMLKDLVMLILTIALAVALNISDKWLKAERNRREELSVRRKQELEGLRNQLNPHFLFNTLNSIYALIDISPSKARNAVHELSKLLRHVLYENPSFVELRKEADFLEHYVALQRLRLPESAKLELNVDIDGHADALVPSMLFVTLIENVFKHGDFSMPATVTVYIAGDSAVCITRNKIRQPSDTRQPSQGIGLSNLRRRIELLYPSGAGLKTETDGGFFTVTLEVPLKERNNQNN